MGLKMKNVNIMGVHKKAIYVENCLKGGGLVKNREGVFEGEVDASMHTDLILVHDRT